MGAELAGATISKGTGHGQGSEAITPTSELTSRLRAGLLNATSTQHCAMFIKEGRRNTWEEMSMQYLDTALKQSGSFTNENLGKVAEVQFSSGNKKVLAVQLSVKTNFTDAGGNVNITESQSVCWLNAIRFLTVDEASKYEHAGSTALKWATESVSQSGAKVSRVVQAADGYFYPCGEKDLSIKV